MTPYNPKKYSIALLSRGSSIWRTILAFLHDVVVAGLAWVIAYLLRFNFSIPIEHVDSLWLAAMFIIPLQVYVFIQFGLYKGVWRFASIPDLKRILKAVFVAAFIMTALLFMFKPAGVVVPRSVLILDPVLLVLMMGGSIPGETRTLAISIYDRVQAFDFESADRMALLLLLLSLLAVAASFFATARLGRRR